MIENNNAALNASAAGKKLDSKKNLWSHKSNLKKCIVFYFQKCTLHYYADFCFFMFLISKALLAGYHRSGEINQLLDLTDSLYILVVSARFLLEFKFVSLKWNIQKQENE